MSQSGATPNGSPWGYAATSQPLHSRIEMPSPEDYHRDVLNKAYQKALAALTSAQIVVAGIAHSLYDVEAGQTDVSARLSGRPAMRYTGRKRKLSPSVYDYSDSCFAGAAGKADTPTHDLLPASRSELRSHQLLAVRWLASLELQGAGGVLADELEQDRRAEVAGLLSHLLMLAPLTSLSSSSSLPAPQEGLQGFAGGSGSGGGAGAATGAGGGAGGGGGGNIQICLLLAPGGSLGGWAEAIREHVDVSVHVHDGTAGSAAALQAACSSLASRGPGDGVGDGGGGPVGPIAQQQPLAVPVPPLGIGRPCTGVPALAAGVPTLQNPHALPGSNVSTGSSSAAGVGPPNPYQPFSSTSGAAPAASPLLRPAGSSAAGQHKFLLVVLAPLEHLHRDAGLLSQIPQRLLVVDLAPYAGGGGVAAAAGDGGGYSASGSGGGGAGPSSSGGSDATAGDSGGCSEPLFRPFGDGFGQGSEPGSASGSGFRPGLNFGLGLSGLEGGGRQRQGMDLESYPHLHLLTRLPAACRVLLSAGIPEPSGDGIWLLLQLLAPKVHRPLWEAVCELQQGLLASGPVGAHSKEAVLSEVHGRLWGLLRPVTLHRRARDVDLTTMRAVTTNLNLYDHFSAARADGGA